MTDFHNLVTETVCNALNAYGAQISFPPTFDSAEVGSAISDALDALREHTQTPLSTTERDYVSRMEDTIYALGTRVRELTDSLALAKANEQYQARRVQDINEELAGATIVPRVGSPWQVPS